MSERSEDDSTEVETPGDLPEGTVTAEDESRRKFREALEKKKFAHHSRSTGSGPQAQHPHSAPAKPQRTFRRKSG